MGFCPSSSYLPLCKQMPQKGSKTHRKPCLYEFLILRDASMLEAIKLSVCVYLEQKFQYTKGEKPCNIYPWNTHNNTKKKEMACVKRKCTTIWPYPLCDVSNLIRKPTRVCPWRSFFIMWDQYQLSSPSNSIRNHRKIETHLRQPRRRK